MATTTAPATDKQVRFANALIDEVAALDPTVNADGLRTIVAESSRKQASFLIDSLIESRRILRQQARDAAAADVPEGIHYLDGDVIKVQRSAAGRLYAKVLDRTTETFGYAGQRPLRQLSEATVMTADQAAEFGKLYGVCAVCGRTLTNEESIERGIGPVCAGRF